MCFVVSDPARHHYSVVLTFSPPSAYPTPVSSTNPKQASPGLGFKERGSRLPLNLVRLSRQQSVEREGGDEDVLITPSDPLGATPLLPWKTEIVGGGAISGHDQRQPQKIYATNNGHDKTDGECPPLYGGQSGFVKYGGGGRAGGGMDSRTTVSTTAATAAASSESEQNSGPARTRNHHISSSSSRAVGDWRNEASTRFMVMWKEFVEHEKAPLDSQYDTVRDIYQQLVGRFGVGGQAAKTRNAGRGMG